MVWCTFPDLRAPYRNVTDELSEGQEVLVKVLDVDNRGRVKLSMKEVKEGGSRLTSLTDFSVSQ